MRLNPFLSAALAGCWALEPNTLRLYAGAMRARYMARGGADVTITADVEDESPAGRPAIAAARPVISTRAASGAIAVLSLQGVVMQHAGMIEACGGGTSTDTFTQALRAAMADDTVSQILVNIDSPGGSVYGVNELAAEIRDARATKPIVGVANSMAASAAYWIGSACSELYCTPGGEVGSIGVIAAHEDMSKALEAEGITVRLFTYGKYKAEGNPYGPLDAEGDAAIQAQIDSYGLDFTSAVAKGRNLSVENVRKDMGQGRMLRGTAAQAAGMVDGVATVDEVIRKMQRSARQPAKQGRSALLAARNELALLS